LGLQHSVDHIRAHMGPPADSRELGRMPSAGTPLGD
jgi:hypothetical protein